MSLLILLGGHIPLSTDAHDARRRRHSIGDKMIYEHQGISTWSGVRQSASVLDLKGLIRVKNFVKGLNLNKA